MTAMFTAWGDGRFDLAGRRTRCSVGRAGMIDAALKREGDGKTPVGNWLMRRVLYRPDRGGVPMTGLRATAIEPDDGWCDAPDDLAYNRPVRLPYRASCERMWREDALYDLVCVLAHNDDPPRPHLGSAVFLHVSPPTYGPTQGCVGLSRPDLEALLALAGPGAALEVRA